MKKRNSDLTLDEIRELCVPDGDCWLWLRNSSHKYGVITLGGKNRKAYIHRWTYKLANGPIPDGLEIDHLCRKKRCCNPAHLEAVTGKENNMRSNSLSARNARKTHCRAGHELVPENLTSRSIKRGERECRICAAARKRSEEQRAKRRISRAKNWEREKALKRERRRAKKLMALS